MTKYYSSKLVLYFIYNILLVRVVTGLAIYCFLLAGVRAQCPNILYSIPTEACRGEVIAIVNNSTNTDSYFWDFCVGDNLNQNPDADRILSTSSFGSPFDTRIIHDGGMYYGFVPDNSDGDLIRLDFGAEISSTPSFNNLGSPGGIVLRPLSIDIEKEGNTYYGLLTGYNTSKLFFLDFGTDLESTPTAVDISSGLGLVNPSYVEILFDGTNYFAFVVNNAAGQRPVTLLSFGTSLSNTPSRTDLIIGTTDQLATIKFLKECDNWIAFVNSRGTGEIYRLNFGTDLSSAPVIDEINGITGLTLDNPLGISVVEDDSVYLFVTSRNGPFYRLSLPSATSNQVNGVEISSGLSNDWGITVHRENSNWYGYRTNFGGRIDRLTFPSNCDAQPQTSVQETPEVIFFETGSKPIVLVGTSLSGEENRLLDEITVTSDTVPDIDIVQNGVCVSALVQFQTLVNSGSVTSYSWDFDNDGMEDSNQENPTHQFLTTGTHTVRLDVSDGTCTNFVTQQITIYPDPPSPVFSAVTDECVGASISFTNTTDESLHTGVISYEWDFNGEGMSTDRDPSFTFLTPGTKQVTLKSIIPGCEITSSAFEINVSAGPTSAFSASSLSICEGESISFTDQSTGSPVGFSWNFGDGFNSTSQNPNHLYTTAGNYDVMLTVTDALGCDHTTMQEVVVSSLPNVAFDFDVPCTSSEGIQFTDLTTVSGADIVSRSWFVGDVLLAEAQDLQNPILNFGSEGTVNVRLVTLSSNGCESSYNEDILILPTPQPDFSVTVGCAGETSSFSDLTSSPGNAINTWLWTLDGTTYNSQNINHTFSGTGQFDVTLEVTGQNFCSETTTQTITILELPTVNFNVNGDCSNETIMLTDASTVFQDPIVSREWRLDGAVQGNGTELLLESLAEGTYDLTLEVTTQSGCITNTSQQLLINQAPQSIFTSNRNFGIPEDRLTFTNQSVGASDYQWLLDGEVISTEPGPLSVEFPTAGTFELSLVSGNALGCNDTTRSEILIAVPEVDLSIGQFEVVENQNTGTIFLEIENNSNLPVEVTEAVIELQNQFSVTEQVQALIGIGEKQLVSLNVGIPLNTTELSYLCVTLNSQYVLYPDISPVNNEKCITIEPAVIVESPFPNPAISETRVKLVAPEAGMATISLFNSSGKIEFLTQEDVIVGLNNFFISLNSLKSGIYFVEIQYQNTRSVRRVIKL